MFVRHKTTIKNTQSARHECARTARHTRDVAPVRRTKRRPVWVSTGMSRDAEEQRRGHVDDDFFEQQLSFAESWSNSTTSKKEEEDESKSSTATYTPSVSKVQQLEYYRRCERGDCCVYSVWYDPGFALTDHGCEHVHRPLTDCCAMFHPSLLKSGVLQILPSLYPRSDTPSANKRRKVQFAGRHRRRKRNNTKDHAKTDVTAQNDAPATTRRESSNHLLKTKI